MEGPFKRLSSCVHRVSRHPLQSAGFEPRFASASGLNKPGGTEGPMHPSEVAADAAAHFADPHKLEMWSNPVYRTLGPSAREDLKYTRRNQGHKPLS